MGGIFGGYFRRSMIWPQEGNHHLTAGAAVVIMEKSKTPLFQVVVLFRLWQSGCLCFCFSYYVSVSVTFSLSVQLHLLLQTKTLATALGSLLAQLTCALEL